MTRVIPYTSYDYFLDEIDLNLAMNVDTFSMADDKPEKLWRLPFQVEFILQFGDNLIKHAIEGHA